jgi:crotonobetainyl-CoA:carnitine CoA-transferase CaiB-like acyl-CoA transferase|tara:strand:- start:3847 stop:5115 length:1269 start_codon:yes stop_codon:yes gene_type:complete
MAGPLSNLTVVELATAIQGPAVGLYFSNMGARVIKVEPPIGDGSRYHRGVKNELPENIFQSQFLAMNKGKESVCIDLKTEIGRDFLEVLLGKADIFISNYRASALERIGLELTGLNARFPQLIVGHVNGFGPRGPDADKAMLDGAAQARGGIANLTGKPGETSTPPGAAIADHAGAMQLALACVTALESRHTTGQGQVVRTSSLGAQLWLHMWELQHSFLTGNQLDRVGPHHPNINAPYGVYTTKDAVDFMFVTAMTNDAWTNLWIFFDQPDVLLIEEWDTPGKRIGSSGSEDGVADIRMRLKNAVALKTFEELEAFFDEQPEIIWERVRDHEGVRTDPQNIANNYVVEMDLPTVGKTATVGTLMEYSLTPTDEAVQLPPELGADTASIMAELGFDDSQVEFVETNVTNVRQRLLSALLGTD